MRSDFWLILPSILIAFFQLKVWKRLPAMLEEETEISGIYGKTQRSLYDNAEKSAYIIFWVQALFSFLPITLGYLGILMLRVIGYFLVIGGLFISLNGLRVLKNNWTGMMEYRIKKGQTLETRGVYRYTRHPIYLALLIETLGYELIVTSWLFIPVTLLLTIILISHIQNEEKLLVRKFGNLYLEYRRKTKMLIPFLF